MVARAASKQAILIHSHSRRSSWRNRWSFWRVASEFPLIVQILLNIHGLLNIGRGYWHRLARGSGWRCNVSIMLKLEILSIIAGTGDPKLKTNGKTAGKTSTIKATNKEAINPKAVQTK